MKYFSADLFEAWLKDWDRKLKRDNRKYLPPNTTAAFQPCDQGIIQNSKVHYSRHLLRERITALDSKLEYKLDLLMALHLLRRSWAEVKPETVANCFRKAGFIKTVESMEQTNEKC
uniref:DDE-1 domain-containing protein n=1 Tax=Ditylenchus dipsaci TaxID=166011 RepID=A0A915EU04_9BILA